MSIQILSQDVAIKLSQQTPGSVLVLNGAAGIVYTGSDIPADIRISTIISNQDFANRFTQAELQSALDFAYSGTGNSQARAILFSLQTQYGQVDLTNALTISSIQFWVSVGILTQARATAILTP